MLTQQSKIDNVHPSKTYFYKYNINNKTQEQNDISCTYEA